MAKSTPTSKSAKSCSAEGRAYLAPIVVPKGRKSPVKLIDLFAGIGGFHYGVAAAAADRGRSVKPVIVSEIDDTCNHTYYVNHRVQSAGSIKSLPLEAGEVDILTAGFPCQPFSNSGMKLGLSDPRGQFYNRIEEIIIRYQAKAFVLENVPGIRMNGGGRYESRLSAVPGLKIGKTLSTLELRLAKLADARSEAAKNLTKKSIQADSPGYVIRWIELDSSDFGSPQVRKRVYIVGVRRDLASSLDLQFAPMPPYRFIDIVDASADEDESLLLSSTQERNLRSFMSPGKGPSYKDGMRRVGQAYLCEGGNVGQGYHSYGMVPTLTKVWARFLPVYFPGRNEAVPQVGVPDFRPDARYGSGKVRRASLREVMRLQGFPDNFEHHDSPRFAYEHAGNAVNALVVKHLMSRLLDEIGK